MAKRIKFKTPHSDKPVILKKKDQCITHFLGDTYTCVVVEVLDQHLYKLQYSMGGDVTILPYVTWGCLLKEYSPWHIESKVKKVK